MVDEIVGGDDASTHYSSAQMRAAEGAFRQHYPAFADTARLDGLRATEYARLDEQGHIYLDYTGGGLYAESQLDKHMQLLRRNVFGNPHSSNPTSQSITELDERARAFVLEYFNASPDEYTVVFTPNATGALRLVGESYPFAAGGQFLLLFDNHNSVTGIREFARAKGARLSYLPLVSPELRPDEAQLFAALDDATGATPHLFAYPAQSNFSGVQHPLEWIAEAQARGWDVLVDGAAFVPTNGLNLSKWHPDFVTISFYKMFGYPTGIGCLLVRKAALAKLQRPWFAGGTIWAATLQGDWHVMAEGAAAFEDGTIDYLNLPAVEIGLKHLKSIGVETIHERVICLTGWLLDSLLSMQHRNGIPLVHVYGPWDVQMRGGTIAFNFLDPNGHIVDERVVDLRANRDAISLRTGCFCNPGAGEAAFGLQKQVLVRSIQHDNKIPLDRYLSILGMESGGAVRISLGLATNFADVYRFMQFAETFLDNFPSEIDLARRPHC